MDRCGMRSWRRGRLALAVLLLPTALSWSSSSGPIGAGPAEADVIYVYDALRRLASVIDDAGRGATYRYDPAGNLTAILAGAGGPSITGVAPATGTFGTTVTVSGTGFAAAAGENIVTFNGIPAVVSSSTTTRLVTRVPVGASTGPVTVTT